VSKLKLIAAESRLRRARNAPAAPRGAAARSALVNFPPRRRTALNRRHDCCACAATYNNMAAAAAGGSASSGPERVMRERFKRHRMTIYYRWVANGSRARRRRRRV